VNIRIGEGLTFDLVVYPHVQAYNKMEGDFGVSDENTAVEMARYVGGAIERCLNDERETYQFEQRLVELEREVVQYKVSHHLNKRMMGL